MDGWVPARQARASARVSHATASSSVWSGWASSESTSHISPIISCDGNGHGWLEW